MRILGWGTAWFAWAWSLWETYFHTAAPAFGAIESQVGAWHAALGWHALVGLLLAAGSASAWRWRSRTGKSGRSSFFPQRKVSQPRMRGEG